MKIAVVGTGISGLAIASILHDHHDIAVYEKNNYVGGHSRTITLKIKDESVPVDTGFIVFNHRNYPYLTKFFQHLNVPVEKSDMSFGVNIEQGWLEYGTKSLPFSLFAQKKNLVRTAFYKMLADIYMFNKFAPLYIDSNDTLEKALNEMGLSQWFRDYYLLAMGASIWSTPRNQMLQFPASTFIRFLKNHGLLTFNDQPQWYTVKGGSREYVNRLIAPFEDRIKQECGVESILRTAEGVEIKDSQGNTELFDQVVLACHSDQALKMLGKPTDNEQAILGAIKYHKNEAVLHSDASFMPKRFGAWASWVYLSEKRKDESDAVSLTYWMNNLQPLNTKLPLFVTLNPSHELDEERVFNRYMFEHPVFDVAAVEAQKKIESIQGVDNIWYAGAWQRYGFHEDGLLSALNVAKAMQVHVPWK